MNAGWKTFRKVPVVDLESRLLLDIAENKDIYGRQSLKFIVGGDSQFHKSFVTYTHVFVCIREGKGGFGYFRNINDTNIKISRQQRLFKETYDSVDVAMWLNPMLETLGFQVDQIHCDINSNPKYLSYDMITQVIGYVQAMGFEGVAKPHAWAAMEIADRYSK